MSTKRLKRPRDPLQLAKLIGDIATGSIEDRTEAAPKNEAAAELGSLGGKARAASLSKKKRSEIARKAAQKRWDK
jgi:hypothetical protein